MRVEELSGRVALVTGGAVRIGGAIVSALAEAGAEVLIQYRHSANEALAMVKTLRSRGRRAWALSADLSHPEGCDALWAEAQATAGSVDLLINNAAIFNRTSLYEADAAAFERQWRVNALAPILLTRRLALAIRAAKGQTADARGHAPRAHVINLLDRRVATHEAGTLPYLVSKKALEAFTLSAALELAPDIAVNAVAPGAVLAPPGHAKVSEAAGRAPLSAACQPDDIAQAVVYLATQRCVTGQVLYIDSGQHLWSVG